jgi:hypothetical protein
MKKSPFTLLKDSIENELFDNALELQKLNAEGKQPNADFFLARKLVCELLLQRAEYIYKFGKKPPF